MKTTRTTGRGVILAILLLGASLAQAQPGREEMSPDDAKAVWRVQAISVCRSIDIPRETGRKAADVYIAAREDHRKAMERLRSEGNQGNPRDAFQKYRDLTEQARTKLGAALGEVLSKEQTDKAMEQLGTFSRRWDSYVKTLRDLELERESRRDAIRAVNTCNLEQGKLMGEVSQGDWQAMREKFAKLKEDLDTALEKVLTADQLAKWKEATTRRPRR